MRSLGAGGLMPAVGLAFLLRMLVVLLSFRATAAPSPDHGAFGAEMGWVARSLAIGAGFSSPFIPMTGATALVPPLFPWVLSLIFRWFGVYSVHSAVAVLSLGSLLSALTCIPVAVLAKRAFGRGSGQLAAWVWACYPFAIFFSASQVWDFALTSFLLACSLALLLNPALLHRRRSWGAAGLLSGCTLLSNPSVLPMLLLAGAARLLWAPARARVRLQRLGLFVMGTLLVVAPWIIRNERALGVVSPVRDGFWLEFWAGNHGDTSQSNPPAAHPASNPQELALYRRLGEVQYLREKHVLARAYVRSHPAVFALSTVRRAVRFWTGFWSFDPAYLKGEPMDLPNTFFCGSVTLLMLLGLLRLWRERPPLATLFAAILLLFPLPYYVTHASMDYRQPMEPLVAVLASGALPGARRRLRQHWGRRREQLTYAG